MKLKSREYSFGSTSAIITNIALIIGLSTVDNVKLTIISSLLVIALADNISDTFGIHIYQESEGLSQKVVWFSTLTNFFSRLLTSLGFILIVLIVPLHFVVYVSVIYGLVILIGVSYFIAKSRNNNPWPIIREHLLIAVCVIFLSKLVGNFIVARFR